MAQLIDHLEHSTHFRNSKLISAEQTKWHHQTGVNFEVVCDIVPDPEGTVKAMKLQKRERWLVALMVIAVGILAFDQFYYMPHKKKVTLWKEEIRAADLKLKESSILMKGAETIEAEVSRMEKRLGARVTEP